MSLITAGHASASTQMRMAGVRPRFFLVFALRGSDPDFFQATRTLSCFRSPLGTRRLRSSTSMPTTCFLALKSSTMPGFTSSDSTTSEQNFERRFRQRADFKNGEAQDVALRVDFLHYLVVGGLAKETFALVEKHFEVVGLAVEPYLHSSRGHSCLPFFTVSVRYAVTTNASKSATLTTTHRYLSPIRVPT